MIASVMKKKFNIRNVIFLCLIYLINNFALASADTRSLLGTFDNWDAFELVTNSGEKVCYVITQPKFKKPASITHGNPFITVTHKPLQDIYNEFNFIAGFNFQKGSEVKLRGEGNTVKAFFTSQDGAWGYDSEADTATIKWFVENEGFDLEAINNRGRNVSYSFSLVGFNDAYNAISRQCGVIPTRKATKKDTEEPIIDIRKSPDDDEIIVASSGSGFAVSSDGYVITNNHVIDQCQQVNIHYQGNEIPATVVTYDKQNDLALLKADFNPETVFSLASNSPGLLQDIYVAGYPFGLGISSQIKVTRGIISSLTGINNNFSEVQIDAAIQGGNSGGPIVDEMGNVVGVAVAKLSAKYMLENYGSIPENTNFGVKINLVKNILESNNIKILSENKTTISKSELAKRVSTGTYYISCGMTMALIESLKTQKVFFNHLN